MVKAENLLFPHSLGQKNAKYFVCAMANTLIAAEILLRILIQDGIV